MACANEVYMLENAIYSVLSPEGAASIIYKDASKVEEASEALKLSAQDMLTFHVIEKYCRKARTMSRLHLPSRLRFLTL